MPELIRIDDPDDPRIEPYRDIRERDLVGRRGHFIAEGEVVLRVLLSRSPHAAVSVLAAEKRAGAAILREVPDGVPVYVAAQAVLDRIAGFSMHRGLLALGRRDDPPEAAALLAGGRLVLVLFGIANHDNLGGIFRNAAAFGADAVLLDPQCCDPLYRKAIRVSVGAALIVPFVRLPESEDPLALLSRHGFTPLALSPAGTTPLAAVARPERAALLLGTEGRGLPDAVLAGAMTIRIPMAPGFDSLNVATASGIALHHLLG